MELSREEVEVLRKFFRKVGWIDRDDKELYDGIVALIKRVEEFEEER